MAKRIIRFFDRLEDRTRAKLSHVPFLYALFGGIGVVLFWRGVWHTTDLFVGIIQGTTTFTFYELLDGPFSFILGTAILLLTGVFVSSFIGSRLIISGLSGEKKLTEKTKEEIDTEENQIEKIQETLEKVEEQIEKIESELEEK